MSLLTLDAAHDEILTLFRTAWEAYAPGVNGGTAPRVEWPGMDSGSPPPANVSWARIRVREAISRQTTLAPAGQRRFTRPGIVTVEVYVPIAGSRGLSLLQQLAIIARNAFEGVGTASGLWFRGTRILDVGADRSWNRMNVTAEFQYDEMR